MQQCVPDLAGAESNAPTLDPARECMPCGSWTNEPSHLPHEDQKRAAPYRRAMNPAQGPQIVGGEQEKEDIGRGIGRIELMKQNRNMPAIERRTRDACGGDDDQTFVCRRISAKPVSECGQDSETTRIGKRDGEKPEDSLCAGLALRTRS